MLGKRKCKHCGKEFSPVSSKNIYCCKECHKEDIKDRNKEYTRQWRKRENEKNTRTLTCPYCGVIFKTSNSKRITCGSDACSKERKAENERLRRNIPVSRVARTGTNLEKKVEEANKKKMSYGQLQAEKTKEMYARIEI